jgi:hypothetical protein
VSNRVNVLEELGRSGTGADDASEVGGEKLVLGLPRAGEVVGAFKRG